MFIEAKGLDRIVAFQPGEIPFPGDCGGVSRLIQLIDGDNTLSSLKSFVLNLRKSLNQYHQ